MSVKHITPKDRKLIELFLRVMTEGRQWRLSDADPDVILVDVDNDPGAALQAEQQSHRCTAVIVVSGNSEVLGRASLALTKPLRADKLEALLRKLRTRSRKPSPAGQSAFASLLDPDIDRLELGPTPNITLDWTLDTITGADNEDLIKAIESNELAGLTQVDGATGPQGLSRPLRQCLWQIAPEMYLRHGLPHRYRESRFGMTQWPNLGALGGRDSGMIRVISALQRRHLDIEQLISVASMPKQAVESCIATLLATRSLYLVAPSSAEIIPKPEPIRQKSAALLSFIRRRLGLGERIRS